MDDSLITMCSTVLVCRWAGLELGLHPAAEWHDGCGVTHRWGKANSYAETMVKHEDRLITLRDKANSYDAKFLGICTNRSCKVCEQQI